jgi:hypothetical protein
MLKKFGSYLHKTIIFGMALIAVVFFFAPVAALLSQENPGVFVPDNPGQVLPTKNDLQMNFVDLPKVATGTATLRVAANKAMVGLDFIISGPVQQSFYSQRIKESDSYMYTYNWDTKAYPDGDYTIEARARLTDSPSIIGYISLTNTASSFLEQYGGNATSTPFIPAGTNTEASSTTLLDLASSTTSLTSELTIKFLDKPNTAKDTMDIYAFASKEPDSVVCLLDDKPHTSLMSSKVSANRYGCRWETQYLTDGEYKVTIRAQKGLIQSEDYLIIVASNNPQNTEEDRVDNEDFWINFDQPSPVISGQTTIKVRSSLDLDAMEFRISGEGQHVLDGGVLGANTYRTELETKYMPNGVYTIEAWGKKGLKEATADLQVIVDNQPKEENSSSTPIMYNGVVQEAGMAGGESVPIVRFVDPPTKVKKKIQLKANIYPRADSAVFKITGAQPAEYDGKEISTSTFSVDFNSEDFGDGFYKITVLAKNGELSGSASFNIEIVNNAIADEKSSISIINPKTGANLSGSADLSLRTTGPIVRVGVVQTSGFSIETTKFKLNTFTHRWEAEWDTNSNRNGIYELKAFGYDQKGQKYSSGKIIVFVSNKQTQAQEIPKQTVEDTGLKSIVAKSANLTPPVKAQVSGIKIGKLATSTAIIQTFPPAPTSSIQATLTPASIPPAITAIPAKVINQASPSAQVKTASILATAECRFNGMNNPAECANFLTRQDLPWECKALDITAKSDCDNYLMQKNALELCGTTSPAAVLNCDEQLFNRYGRPKICLGLDNSKCKQAMEDEMANNLLFIPQSVINELRVGKVTQECTKALTKNTDQCLAFLEKKYLPQECQSAGLSSAQACWSRLNRDYGSPAICQGQSPEQCRKMALRSLPLTVQTIIASRQIPKDCRETGSGSLAECEIMTRVKYLPGECRAKSYANKKKCREYMEQEYGTPAKCAGLNARDCRALVDNIILADLADPRVLAESEAKIKNLIGATLVIEQNKKQKMEIFAVEDGMKSKLSAQDIKAVQQVFPLDGNNTITGISFLPAKAESTRQKSGIGAIMVFDADGDGLTDDIEQRLGSDPHKADTDGDGFDDYIETANGYNPVGRGKLLKQISSTESAFIERNALSQPKTSGEVASDVLAIQNIANQAVEINENKKHGEIRFQGKGVPNNIATLFIYSPMPIAITVKTDESGNWSYNLDKTMADGAHTAYVAVIDRQGEVRSKSPAFPFYIKNAQAASANDYVKSFTSSPANSARGLMAWYAMAGCSFLIFMMGLIFLYHQFSREAVSSNE